MVRAISAPADMNLFVCLLNPTGNPVSPSARAWYGRQRCWRESASVWHSAPGWAARTQTDTHLGGGPEIAVCGSWIGIGIVRLDNRAEIARRLNMDDRPIADIELVTRVVASSGIRGLDGLLGDFSVVVWDYLTRTLVAACDIFAIRKLYHADGPGVLAFASRAELLAPEEAYDPQYFAEVVAYAAPRRDATAYRGVTAVPPGGAARLDGRRVAVSRYWSAEDCIDTGPRLASEAEQIEACRELMQQAVANRLTGMGDVWSHLSGGLDSSSVASTAQWMLQTGRVSQGLAGTISWVDSHGTGADEREYSDTVVRRYGLRNEQQIDFVPWQDDDLGPPMTDLPVAIDGLHARYRREAALIRESGGRVLLTGLGGDNLFTGNMVFFADWLVNGRWRLALREMAVRAAQGRVSFWELAYKNAMLPLLPLSLQRRLVSDAKLPAWLPGTTVRRWGLTNGCGIEEEYGGKLGQKYRHAAITTVKGIAGLAQVGITEDLLDVRHPYADRPLVQFALGLPPEMCARPQARKWILRQAMQGILPDAIRARVGKSVAGVMSWSLAADRARWQTMSRDPILADMGCLEPKRFQAAYEAVLAAPDSSPAAYGEVQHTLCVEAWLRARTGRWPLENGVLQHAASVT
jgi:asparagine synthase (glutamine-hydrolysing)